jgi:1-acyl-sn-glycerol-3-phosphate acyltransferase
MRTLIIKEQSQVLGLENMKSIQEAVDRGENVVILSNHQTEADPPVRAQIVSVGCALWQL